MSKTLTAYSFFLVSSSQPFIWNAILQIFGMEKNRIFFDWCVWCKYRQSNANSKAKGKQYLRINIIPVIIHSVMVIIVPSIHDSMHALSYHRCDFMLKSRWSSATFHFVFYDGIRSLRIEMYLLSARENILYLKMHLLLELICRTGIFSATGIQCSFFWF